MSGRHLISGLNRLLAQLLAPGVCLACGHELLLRDHFCAACSQRILRVPNPCHSCGQVNIIAGHVCPACLLNPPRWQKMIAPLHYRALVREYLIQFKYSQLIYLANSLCSQCIDSFRNSEPRPEVLLPVPLHRQRLLQRGYNQALEIAKICSHELGIPVDRHALKRTRDTPSQSGLSASQRGKNILRAFTYSPRHSYRHVAIVDDIVTTGSTVNEITRLLHRAGVESVEVWALARAYRE